MKFVFFIYYLFIFSYIYSQNKSDVYVEYYVQNPNGQKIEYLYANASFSLYDQNQIDLKKNDSIILENDNTYSATVKQTNVNLIKIYSKQNSPIIHFVSQNLKKNTGVVAIDSLPKIQWKLIPDDAKEINGFKCNKAVGEFRGSDIVAYYTSDIPIPFGPFKFKNLPGLILEAYNINSINKYRWVAQKIVINHKNDVQIKFDSTIYDYLPTVSYRSIVTSFENKLDRVDNILKSRSQERGGTLTVGKRVRTSIEKVYEWEK